MREVSVIYNILLGLIQVQWTPPHTQEVPYALLIGVLIISLCWCRGSGEVPGSGPEGEP